MKKLNTTTGPNDVIKHTHFDPSVLQGSTRKRQPPQALTLAFIKRHITLLRENWAHLLNDHGKKNITHHQFIWEKKKQLNRFNKDQYFVPKSARIDFQFHVSQEAEQSEEISTQKKDTDQIITNLQKSQKEQV